MSFETIVKRTWRENHLFSALVELTYRCNLDCFFCYNDTSLKGTPLTNEQYFRFFEDLKSLGALNLILSGGEPLAHPGFFELGARAREFGFVIRIKSNGHALRGTIAQRIRDEVDPFMIELSLHGATAATHDRQTRVPGSFERLLDNVEEMRGLGLRLKLNSALTSWNEAEIEQTTQLARSLDLPLQVDPEVTPRDDGDREPLDISASSTGLTRLGQLREQARERELEMTTQREGEEMFPPSAVGEKHCGAGSATIAVDPYGEIYPCVQWRRSVGNLHETSIRDIWQGSRDLDRIRSLTVDVKKAIGELDPEDRPTAFCPGVSELRSGSPTELFPGARGPAEPLPEAPATSAGKLLPVIN